VLKRLQYIAVEVAADERELKEALKRFEEVKQLHSLESGS